MKKTTKTAKPSKQTVPARLAAEWAGTREPEAELYSAMKSRAMEFGQSASNAGRSARLAIDLLAASLKRETALNHGPASEREPAPVRNLEHKIARKERKTPGAKGSTYVFQLIETVEYVSNQTQQLTPQRAGQVNAGLERDGSVGRWVPLAAAKAAGKGISLASATARLKSGDIPGAFSGELPAHSIKPAAEVVITESGIELLTRLRDEGKVTVSGAGLGLAVTAGFLAKKALVAIAPFGKDRVAQITDAGRAAIATAEAAPEKVRKPRLTLDGKSAPQWIGQLLEKTDLVSA